MIGLDLFSLAVDGCIEAFLALADTIIITRNLIHEAWTRYRWRGCPNQRP